MFYLGADVEKYCNEYDEAFNDEIVGAVVAKSELSSDDD